MILVVDDVPAMAEQYAYDLRRVGGYETIVAAGGDEAFDVLGREPIECVVLDLEMPGTDGFDLLRQLKQRGIDTPVIVYTGTGSYDRCVQAVRLGAYGFIDKAEPIERVVHEIESAVSRGRMARELRSLRTRFDGETSLIGDSVPMRQLRAAIARIAPIPSSVLIVGESGTGKELVARELHRLGPGVKTPLVALNSAALPEQLVESELFGHERGAFTGADRLRQGAFESAANGTLFLDEIGELPLPAQAKLLRVLEDRQVMRLGGSRAVPLAARVVAATNRDLEREVEEGRFRQVSNLAMFLFVQVGLAAKNDRAGRATRNAEILALQEQPHGTEVAGQRLRALTPRPLYLGLASDRWRRSRCADEPGAGEGGAVLWIVTNWPRNPGR